MIPAYKIFARPKRGILAYVLIIFTMACSASELKVSPQQFWETFRLAVISNNNNDLINKTHFPLELRGVDDSQPVALYKKDQFKAIFNKVLNQPVVIIEGDNIIMKTTKDIILTTKELSDEHLLTKDSFRVDQLQFEIKNNQWYLVRMYLEE